MNIDVRKVRMNTIHQDTLHFFSSFSIKRFSGGEVLLRPGDVVSRVYYIKTGLVRQYIISDNGEVRTVNIFKPRSFFPMSNALNKKNSDYFFETIGVTELIDAPSEKVVMFLENNPHIALDLLRRVYSGTDGVLEKMVLLMSGSAKDRLAVELLLHAERFGEKQSNNTVEILITEQQLGNQTGLARETVSRELAKYKADGTLEVSRGKLRINTDRLKKSRL